MVNFTPACAPRAPRTLLLVLAILAVGLNGCGAAVRNDASRDVRAFLAAVSSDDRAAMEAHLDRKALREDLKAQLLDVPEVRDLHAQLGVGVGDVAVDKMIAPQAAALARGGPLVALPTPVTDKALKRQIKVLDNRHVCLVDPGVRGLCLLTFAKRGRGWKLVKLHANDLGVQLPESTQGPVGSVASTEPE